MSTHTALALVSERRPIPIADPGAVVPEGWFEREVVPWVDGTADAAELDDAALRFQILGDAYKRMHREEHQITQALRYMELRAGELMLRSLPDDAYRTGRTHSDKEVYLLRSFDTTVCRAFARNRRLVVDMIEASTLSQEISAPAIMRAIKEVDPRYKKKREKENQNRRAKVKQLRQVVERSQKIVAREAQRQAATRSGDHVGKSWNLTESLLRELDAAILESSGERKNLLVAARLMGHEVWDVLGQAVGMGEQ